MKRILQFLCTFLVITSAASATTITFDDESNQQLLGTYNGLQWSGFEVLNGTTEGRGYANAVVSGTQVASDPEGHPAQITSTTVFNLVSGYLTGALRDGLSVEVQGFVGTTLTYDHTYVVNTTGPMLINFNYTGVDEVNFIASGGTLHPGYNPADNFASFAMDNLTISAPDNAGTITIFGIVLGVLPFLRRKLAS